jgi:D-sedoheptulose 7-phosphate isomerase
MQLRSPHLQALERALFTLDEQVDVIVRWSDRLVETLVGGGRLLVAGNGGSAAQAQHLSAEIVGRYLDDRPPFSAIALHADTSALTAIGNDYGPHEVFARGVRAHGRPGDVFMGLSTSGRSINVIRAAETARKLGLTVLALTGPAPNALEARAHDSLCVDAATPTVQEVHQVVIHLLCEFADRSLLPHAPTRAPGHEALAHVVGAGAPNA